MKTNYNRRNERDKLLERSDHLGYIENLRALIGHQPVILVGSVVVIVDQYGRILLQQRRHPKGVWGLPGGLMELGESTEQVAKREVLEETGLTVDQLQLIHVYSGANHFTVAKNGDQFYTVTTAYYTQNVKGKMMVEPSESIQFQYRDPEDFPEKMIGTHRAILDDFLKIHYPHLEIME